MAGNVRELQHVLERALILTQGNCLALDNWFQEHPCSPSSRLEEVERAHVVKALEATGLRLGGTGGTAELLGLEYTTLESRTHKLGIPRKP